MGWEDGRDVGYRDDSAWRKSGSCNDNVLDINSMRYHMNNQVIY